MAAGAAWVSVLAVLAIVYFLVREALLPWTNPSPGEPLHPLQLFWGEHPLQPGHRPFVWQPIAISPKFSLVPLVVGTLRVSLLAVAVAWPLGVLSALYSTWYARGRAGLAITVGMELLEGVPTVVLGAIGLTLVALPLQQLTGTFTPLNALLAGLMLGLWATPYVYRFARVGFTRLPAGLFRVARGLGMTEWCIFARLLLPSAAPWLAAGLVGAFSLTFGEAMMPVMLTGNSPVVSWEPLASARTLSATISAEMGTVVFRSTHYSILFLMGVILLAVALAAHEAVARLTRAGPRPEDGIGST